MQHGQTAAGPNHEDANVLNTLRAGDCERSTHGRQAREIRRMPTPRIIFSDNHVTFINLSLLQIKLGYIVLR